MREDAIASATPDVVISISFFSVASALPHVYLYKMVTGTLAIILWTLVVAFTVWAVRGEICCWSSE
jgi:ABC-type Fe3+ transport system permease subunit